MRTIKRVKLTGEPLRLAVQPLLKEFGASDRERLESLLTLFQTEENIPLSACLRILFPKTKQTDAQANLRAYRNRFNSLAKENKLTITFETDTQKKTPPDQRLCWFSGPDTKVARAESFATQSIATLGTTPIVPPQAIGTTGKAMERVRQPINIFVSYSHQHPDLAVHLKDNLKCELEASKKYKFTIWFDDDINMGDEWHDRIQHAIDTADIGLFLLSPAILSSEYVIRNELPGFINHGTPIPVKLLLPVNLVRVDYKHHDLHGIERLQIFPSDDKSKVYGELTTSSKKRAFTHHLYLKIEKSLDDWFVPPNVSSPKFSSPKTPKRQKISPHTFAKGLISDKPPEVLVPALLHPTGLDELENNVERVIPSDEKKQNAVQFLTKWASSGSELFCALLGEYGIGKTTTLMELTREMLVARKKNPSLPLPIYIDLRLFVSAKKDNVPTLKELLDGVIERNWKLENRQAFTSADIIHLVRDEGAVIFFDGLDEKIVHMTSDQAQAFIRELWSVLPPPSILKSCRPGTLTRRSVKASKQTLLKLNEDKTAHSGKPGKMLISCRSHYFRDVWTQNAMLSGEDREGINRKTDYRACIMLPFNEEQIRTYFKSLLGSEDAGNKAFELITSIHNLRDLAARPYLLSLIADHLDEIEILRAKGQTVNAAKLYELITRRWLGRDDGKHQIEARHKRLMMERLAAALWREEKREWEADRLEDWLDQFLLENPAIAGAYANKDRTLLKEDLRTATFVLRPDGEKSRFRFAHTSLQEYFLACHLLSSLKERKHQEWSIPGLSKETLEFFGQLLESETDGRALRAMEAILAGDDLTASISAFGYWLIAKENGLPQPKPNHVNLSGANLERSRFGGSLSALMNLRGANLSHACLDRARLEFIDLSGANLSGATARQTEFLQVRADNINADGVDLTASIWRNGSARNGKFLKAAFYGSEWINMAVEGIEWPSVLPPETVVVVPPHKVGKTPVLFDRTCAQFRFGNARSVMSCVYSPDGERILSGSDDHTLRVWDARSGQCVLTLHGHGNGVRSCGYSPNGERIVSASDDKTVRVWDAHNGQCLLTLQDHKRAVAACGYSPDGERIVSGSWDKTVQVWDARSGQCLLTLLGHESGVRSCGYSPNGERIVSASDDKTVRVWDARSGQCLLTLLGHENVVTACGYSPDGERIVSGSNDKTVRVWDARSGQCLLTLLGHKRAVAACGHSPDGERIVSGSFDKTVRVWDARSGQSLLTLQGHKRVVVTCGYSPDGERIVSGSFDKTVRVWDVRSEQSLLTFQSNENWVAMCGYSPDGEQIVSGSHDKTVRVWDARSGQCLLTLQGHKRAVVTCGYWPDGEQIVSGSHDKTVRVWDARSGQSLLTLRGHERWITACGYSPDGERIVSGSVDKTVRVWDARSGQCLLILQGHEKRVSACVYSPDGERIVSGSWDKTMRMWDARSGQCLLTLKNHELRVNACVYSPDGERIVSGASDKTLRVWDARSGLSLLTLQGHEDSIMACGYSPDGERIVSGLDDNTLRVWDAQSGQCLLTLQGHVDGVNACGFSPDGERIVSGSYDKTVRVWNAKTGEPIWQGTILPENQSIVLDGKMKHILSATPDAWRYFGWRYFDEKARQWRVLPAEYFGPLPTGDPK